MEYSITLLWNILHFFKIFHDNIDYSINSLFIYFHLHDFAFLLPKYSYLLHKMLYRYLLGSPRQIIPLELSALLLFLVFLSFPAVLHSLEYEFLFIALFFEEMNRDFDQYIHDFWLKVVHLLFSFVLLSFFSKTFFSHYSSGSGRTPLIPWFLFQAQLFSVWTRLLNGHGS